ncbi:MAG TPA: proton-conducting transporter membrane subunit, partial [Chthoniobacterales bacterium]
FMLSLAGLPPLAGFFGKFYLFVAAFRAGPQHGLLWLIALALFGSLISLYYYLVVLRAVLSGGITSTSATSAGGFGLLQRLTIGALAASVVALGVLPPPLLARIIAAIPG